jgi:hypothetical protein
MTGGHAHSLRGGVADPGGEPRSGCIIFIPSDIAEICVILIQFVTAQTAAEQFR